MTVVLASTYTSARIMKNVNNTMHTSSADDHMHYTIDTDRIPWSEEGSRTLEHIHGWNTLTTTAPGDAPRRTLFTSSLTHSHSYSQVWGGPESIFTLQNTALRPTQAVSIYMDVWCRFSRVLSSHSPRSGLGDTTVDGLRPCPAWPHVTS